ncbi:MAG: hypothetical protein KJ831_09885, partial [Candidatus Eisenbacteria bacterium]|nr:hypothetical protein [Candidatus Eisenbacteria bacterium]
EFYMMLLQSAEWYSIPVVLMTANPTRENMKNLRALPVPPDYLLCKPFRPDMLVQIMETILKQDHPLCILRDLQRRKLNVQRKMLQIRKAMEDQAPADAAKIERARSIIITMTNKLISLKRERTQAVNLYADPSLDLDEKIKSLGTEIAQIEAFIKGHEDQRKSQLERKRELLLVSKSLEEIDRKIQVLNKTIAKEGILDLRSPSKMGKEMLDWLASGSGGG